nr:cytochrome P450 6HX3 [Pagiophloeus tsushimanus]
MTLLWDSESVWVNISLFIATVFFSIYAYFKYSYTYWARKGVPYLPPSFPLGNNDVIGPDALTFGLESEGWYRAFKKMGVRFGGVFNFWNKALVLMDPALIKDVMTKDFNNFINRDFYSNPHNDRKTYNLFAMLGEDWRHMRHKITPAFTSAKMRLMFESVLKSTERLDDLFEKAVASKDDIMLRFILDKYTMDNIGVVAFGLNFNCQLSEDDKFRKIADVLNIPTLMDKLNRLLCRLAPGLGRKLRMNLIATEITNFFENIIQENVELRRKLNTRRNDFTQIMMDLQDASEKNDNQFNMDDLIANCVAFFLAGFDTSSKTMQYTLTELARNQDIQDKARNEIKRVLEKYNGVLTYEGLQEMTYLRQVVDETLRLYPPVLTLTRICQNDYKLKGSDTIIEKGTTVLISSVGLHRDPELFPNPNKYDPERFSPANKQNIAPYTYLPFGDGPRNCVGLRFGIMQVTSGLVRILSNYKIEPSPKLPYPLNIKPGKFLLETEEVHVRAVKIK